MAYETTQALRNFTEEIRQILNSTEYGFHHLDKLLDNGVSPLSVQYYADSQVLLNSRVSGQRCCATNDNNCGGRTLLLASIHNRHHSYPKWKLETYLELIGLVDKLNEKWDRDNESVYFQIEFSGNVPNEPFTRSFSEQMKIDLC